MRIRIEIEDEGLKSVYEFTSQGAERRGDLREKIIDYLTASGVFSDSDVKDSSVKGFDQGGTLMERLESFIRYEFPDTWFTSQELRERYETVIDDIKLSTVSTYLSRMNRDHLLERRGNRNNRQYRLVEPSRPGSGSRVRAPDEVQTEGRRSAEERY
jgi:DNA-binding PadR family transcriptional regulator